MATVDISISPLIDVVLSPYATWGHFPRHLADASTDAMVCHGGFVDAA